MEACFSKWRFLLDFMWNRWKKLSTVRKGVKRINTFLESEWEIKLLLDLKITERHYHELLVMEAKYSLYFFSWACCNFCSFFTNPLLSSLPSWSWVGNPWNKVISLKAVFISTENRGQIWARILLLGAYS